MQVLLVAVTQGRGSYSAARDKSNVGRVWWIFPTKSRCYRSISYLWFALIMMKVGLGILRRTKGNVRCRTSHPRLGKVVTLTFRPHLSWSHPLGWRQGCCGAFTDPIRLSPPCRLRQGSPPLPKACDKLHSLLRANSLHHIFYIARATTPRR